VIFFKVTQNINIKITDKSLVKYIKPKKVQQDQFSTIYCATYDEFVAIKNVFKSVDDKYQAKILQEKKIKSQKEFPKPLGILNDNEYFVRIKKEQYADFYINQQFTDINTQLYTNKKDITVCIIGSLSTTIGQMVCSTTAIRILYQTLIKKFRTVKIDIFINASQNRYYSRDKQILQNCKYINNIYAMAVTVKKLFEYDFYIDMGSFEKTIYYEEFNYTDAYLYKFGIDYKVIPNDQKYNEIDLKNYKPKKELVQAINEAKSKSKLLLFHPYSSALKRSMPSDLAKDMLQKLILKAQDYTVVTALNINKVKDDNYLNLSEYSKDYYDFVYIISQVDSIISVDTSTYHIADAFAIPTVVIFTTQSPTKRIKYYMQTKAIRVKYSAKNLSNFIYENDLLTLYEFKGWRSIKIKKILKLLRF
jgi:ADP-heptose:LPS heptosyltransferase